MPPFDQTRDLPPDEEQRLVTAMLQIFRDWPDCKLRFVSWAELAEQLPESLPYPPEAMEFFTYRCKGDGFLQEFKSEGDRFRIGGLTDLGEQLLHNKTDLAVRLNLYVSLKGFVMITVLYFLLLALRLWLATHGISR